MNMEEQRDWHILTILIKKSDNTIHYVKYKKMNRLHSSIKYYIQWEDYKYF